jgi:hypothetical protein
MPFKNIRIGIIWKKTKYPGLLLVFPLIFYPNPDQMPNNREQLTIGIND